MKTVLNHIAFLVPDAVKSAEYLRQFDFKIGPAEKKLSQIQDSTTNNLILMMNGKEMKLFCNINF